jgi:hypothetical protein
MLFRDKPASVLYIENCLINPPPFLGTLSELDYLREVHFEAIGGLKNQTEVSEIVGDLWGGICSKITIAIMIVSVRSLECSKSEKRSLDKSLDYLTERQRSVLLNAKAIARPYFEVDEELVIGRAENSLSFLMSGRQPNVVLQYEMQVTNQIRQVREDAMSKVPSSLILKTFMEGISSFTL